MSKSKGWPTSFIVALFFSTLSKVKNIFYKRIYQQLDTLQKIFIENFFAKISQWGKKIKIACEWQLFPDKCWIKNVTFTVRDLIVFRSGRETTNCSSSAELDCGKP